MGPGRSDWAVMMQLRPLFLAIWQAISALAIASEGDVLAFSAQLATRIATLRQQAQTLRDPAYAAALTADLDRLEDMRLAWQQLVPLASLADRNVLATVRNATPWLVAAGVPTAAR